MDFAMLLVYALAVWSLSSLGDVFDKRKVMTIVHATAAFSYFLLGLGAHLKIKAPAFYYMVLVMVGMSQAIVFPTMISILGDWFPKRIRGTVIGFWTTSINIGNIIGVEVASALV